MCLTPFTVTQPVSLQANRPTDLEAIIIWRNSICVRKICKISILLQIYVHFFPCIAYAYHLAESELREMHDDGRTYVS